MSCFVVSDELINTIVAYAMKSNIQLYVTGVDRRRATYDEVRQQLKRDNIRSYQTRYNDDEKLPESEHQVRVTPVKYEEPVQIIKAIDCFRYQCDEHDNWENCPSNGWTREIREHIIRNLPGYAEAIWGF